MKFSATLLLISLSVLLCLSSYTTAGPSKQGNTALQQQSTQTGEVHYIVMIDAGSTGSRAHCHQYTVVSKDALPVIQPSENKKIKPGLSSYALKPDNAKEPITELLNYIKSVIPMSHWRKTPIYLQATAGLRSVTPEQAEAILKTVRDTLKASEFVFEDSYAKIISGTQEGLNGWIAANYLLGTFNDKNRQSMGIVEMGGSSLQLTFAPSQPSEDDKKHLIKVVMNNQEYWLYTYSYLQYGLQAAEKLLQLKAIDSIEEKGNPCYAKGFKHSSVGHFEQCASTLTQWIFDKTTHCGFHRCSFNGIYQPPIHNEPFFAIENFFYTSQFFGLVNEETDKGNKVPVGNQFSAALKQKGMEYCGQEWANINKANPTTPPSELASYCFAAAYETSILEYGFGFTANSNIRAARLIEGKPIDWELGAVLLELNQKDQPAKTEQIANPQTSHDIKKNQPIATDSLRFTTLNAVTPSTATAGQPCQSCLLFVGLILGVAAGFCYGVTRYTQNGSGKGKLSGFGLGKVSV